MDRPIWEQYDISIEEYGMVFNKALDEAWERLIGNNIYLVNNVGGEQRVHRITNIKSPAKD